MHHREADGTVTAMTDAALPANPEGPSTVAAVWTRSPPRGRSTCEQAAPAMPTGNPETRQMVNVPFHIMRFSRVVG